ncbi:MAG: porin [Hyphomicrobiaceae bacterium]|nr:porin [Hyphomicrobiaceae bacterium]
MKKSGICAVMAAGLLASGLSAGSAKAADLGGDCCADLEERVAELEATTVRKGNRKVSLTISGWVAEQVTWWDDGVESNAYVSGIGKTLSSHFKMSGSANISADVSAGYVLHVETNSADPTDTNQHNDDAGSGIYVLQSYWFLKSQSLGKLSVGQLSHASDNAALLVDGSGSLVPANWVHFDGLNFGLRVNGGPPSTATWADLAYCRSISAGFAGDCNGYPNNAIRYDSPTFGGFSVSASWGEDDFWDVAGRYAGEFNGIKLAAAVAYHHTSEENTLLGQLGLGNTDGVAHRDSGYFQAGLYIEHVPTGLFAYGAYGQENDDTDWGNAAVNANLRDGTTWYVKAGLRRRWTPLGHTVVYGEYSENLDHFSPTFAGQGMNDSTLRQWGVGIVQEIDAAAMSIWLSYRNLDADFGCATGRNRCTDLSGIQGNDFDDLHIVKFGALINF